MGDIRQPAADRNLECLEERIPNIAWAALGDLSKRSACPVAALRCDLTVVSHRWRRTVHDPCLIREPRLPRRYHLCSMHKLLTSADR